MKASDLRAIMAKSQRNNKRPLRSQLAATTAGTPRRRRGIGDYIYYGALGFFGFSVIGLIGVMLESPEAREARWADESRRDQVRATERQQTEVEAASQAKEDAKLTRLASCTKMQNFAYPASKDEVRARLKAPSTASFPWTPIVSQHVGDCKFQVLAYVDAQNGFGAMIRSNYVATLTYDPANERWRVTSVKLEN